MNAWTKMRAWCHQRRVRHKTAHFMRLAVARGWTTPRLPEPSPLVHGRVLVVAPHVDDEAIGCGGTLLLHRQAGDPVHVVYALEDPHQQAVRQQEGNRAGAWLGAAVTHLRRPHDVEAVRAGLEPIIRREQPAVTYFPWPLENHEGHVAVSHAIGRLLEAGVACGALWCYEVWTPLIPNRIVDITTVLPHKQQLLALYASQCAQQDLVGMSLGLSRYRGGLLAAPPSAAAEVFLALTADEFRHLLRHVSVA